MVHMRRTRREEYAMRGMWSGISAAPTSSKTVLLSRTRVPARAAATLAASKTLERPRLPRQPVTRTTRVAQAQSRLLARISPRAPAVPRTQPQAAASTQRPAGRTPDCKDGRFNSSSTRPLRHIPDQPGTGDQDCKDGRVDGGNYLAFKPLWPSGEALQREDVIGTAQCDCYRRAV